ncbi:MAG TPA: dihydrofolate reductase family protein [Clostridiaceae bacterium]
MEVKRKVVLYIAQSLDGFIARADGDIGWLSAVEREGEDYGYSEFIETVDTVIMGRKTYEKVLSFGIEFPHRYKKCYVLSRTKRDSDRNVQFYSGDAAELVRIIRNGKGKDIFIDGGAEVVREFLSEDLIDEYVISIIPMLICSGIRLFKETDTERKLNLIYSKAYESGPGPAEIRKGLKLYCTQIYIAHKYILCAIFLTDIINVKIN